MTVPISIKKPEKMILQYEGFSIELVCGAAMFKYIIFDADEATAERLEKRGVLVGPAGSGCKGR